MLVLMKLVNQSAKYAELSEEFSKSARASKKAMNQWEITLLKSCAPNRIHTISSLIIIGKDTFPILLHEVIIQKIIDLVLSF